MPPSKQKQKSALPDLLGVHDLQRWLADSNAELAQRTAELAVIHSVQQGISGSLDLRGIVSLVGDKLREVFQTRSLSIRWFDDASGLTHNLYEHHDGVQLELPTHVSANTASWKKLSQTRQAWSLGTSAEIIGAGLQRAANSDEQVRSAVFVPMLVGERLSGLIALRDYERDHAYGAPELRLLTTVAASLSLGLESARLFDEAKAAREATRNLNVKQAETGGTKSDKEIEEVAKVAATQAKIYFTYQDDPHSNIGAVIKSDLQMDDPEPVPGWAGRYRVSGTAYRQYINNQSSGFGRGTKDFEILIQTSERKKPEIVDIWVK